MSATESRPDAGTSGAADHVNAECSDGTDSTASGGDQLQPNRADIAEHIYQLAPPDFAHRFPDAKIEIAFSNASLTAITGSQWFSVFDLAKAIECAVKQNEHGLNVYVSVALRQG